MKGGGKTGTADVRIHLHFRYVTQREGGRAGLGKGTSSQCPRQQQAALKQIIFSKNYDRLASNTRSHAALAHVLGSGRVEGSCGQ